MILSFLGKAGEIREPKYGLRATTAMQLSLSYMERRCHRNVRLRLGVIGWAEWGGDVAFRQPHQYFSLITQVTELRP
jgi:hypothetical protein